MYNFRKALVSAGVGMLLLSLVSITALQKEARRVLLIVKGTKY
jgi:hypothetical protein